MILKDKKILINGGAGLLGTAFAKKILEQGGFVSVVDPNQSKLDALSEELDSKRSIFFQLDPKNSRSVDDSINFSLKNFNKLDAVVHTAYPKSEKWGADLENLEEEFLFKDLNMQLGGTIIFSKKILKYFKKQGYGNLIHISSIQGISPPKFDHYEDTKMNSPIEYSAMKAGIISLTKYLAKYYRNLNIRVNCISPGGILDNQEEIFIKKYRNSCCSKGLLDSEDIAGTVFFLISDLSQFITGQNIIVDDGWSL